MSRNYNARKLLKKLREIDNKYLPIIKTEHKDPDEHIFDFLELFRCELNKGTNGLLLVNPVFNLFYDWAEWKLKGFQKIYYLSYTGNNVYDKKYSIQRAISKKGTSTKILDSINRKDGRSGNVGIMISINQGEQDCLVCPVSTVKERSEGIWRFYINKQAFQNRKDVCICEDIPKIIKKSGEIYEFKDLKLSEKFANANVELIHKRDWDYYGDIVEAIYNNSIYIDEQHDIYFILSTPVKDLTANNEKGLGGVFFVLDNTKINNTNNKDVISAMKRLTEKLSIRMIHYYENEEKLKNALRAAVSQVMARNMSHNIGSHVLNKLVNAEYLEKFIENRETKDNNYETKETKPSTSYDQIAKFNNYIRCRMDYLSDMSFSVPIMQTTKKAYSDIYKGISGVLLLLENITGLSDFKYSIKFEKIIADVVIELTEQNDYSLAIPNDVLGCQALYNIIENIIRNTAKHRIDKKKPKTVFTIRIREIDFDESILNDTHLTKEYQEHCCIEIFDDIDLTYVHDHESDGKPIPYIKWLCKAQNKIINDPILDLNNKLRASSLGLIEMEASAAYLRQLEVNLIDDPEYRVLNNLKYCNKSKKLDIIKAVIIENNKEKYLGYRIFIKKPQEVLIVTDNQQIISADKKSELHRDGVWIVSSKEFKTHIHENRKVYNHQFVIHDVLEDITISIDNAEPVDMLRYYRTSLPIRIINISKDNIINIFQNDNIDIDSIIKYCWEKWDEKCYKLYPVIYNKRAWLGDHGNDFQNIDESNIYYYYDPLSSIAQNHLPRYSESLSILGNGSQFKILKTYERKVVETNSVVKRQLTESILTNVLVIDERVQEVLKNPHLPGITIGMLYKNIGIKIPDTESKGVNLSESKFDETLINGIKVEINSFTQQYPDGKRNFIVIHYSILERMFATETDRKDAINKYLISLGSIYNVIITSGRGIPQGLPEEVRFINLSALLHAFVDIRSKYLINSVLYSARKSII